MMDHFGTPYPGNESFKSSQPQTFPAPLTKAVEEENPDEWEYEYSNTQTETYYLTLDLTTPEVDPKRKAPKHHQRIKAKWVNPGLGRNKRSRNIKPATYSAVTGERGGGDDFGGEDEIEEEDGDDEGPPAKDSSPKADPKEYSSMPTEVQILNLHSSNPKVSYDGHLYSCNWARNLGTELIFTPHERETTIPTLRKLPGGVDLLAASSARIISNYVEVEARARSESPDRIFKRGSKMKNKEINVPLVAPITEARKDQAVFLQRLVKVKERRGELDQVTIHARKRVRNPNWRKAWNTIRNEERKSLRGVINRSSDPYGERVLDAKVRLQEMDDEDSRNKKGDVDKGRTLASKKQVAGRKKKVTGADDDEPPERVFKTRHRSRTGNVLYTTGFDGEEGLDEDEDEDAPGEDDDEY